MTYTKGPWELVDSFYPSFKEIKGPSFKVSVVMYATDLDESVYSSRMGDLRLMSAAPDLYEALDELCKSFDSVAYSAWTPGMHKAVDALKKARGDL